MAHNLAPVGDSNSSTGHLGVEFITDPQDAQFDICFVHGLTGDRHSTWTYRRRSTEVFWPKLLGEYYTAARVMTYGYDADVVGIWRGTSSNSLHAYGQKLAMQICHVRLKAPRRPIYFIAHSLGGLLIKQALLICLEAHEQPHRRNLLESTSGILFFGTPHRGASIASWGHTVTKLFDAVGVRINHDIVAMLKQKSSVLQTLNQTFLGYLYTEFKHINICCFFESIEMRMIGFVVTPDSATIDTKVSCSLNADHSGMTKFVGRQDEGFLLVVGQFDSWMSGVQLSNKTSPADTPPIDTPPATPPTDPPPVEIPPAHPPPANAPPSGTQPVASNGTPIPDAEQQRSQHRRRRGRSSNPSVTQIGQDHALSISIGGNVGGRAQVGYNNNVYRYHKSDDGESRNFPYASGD